MPLVPNLGIVRLKDFIRSIRACKTAADERAVIAKASAAVRTSFKEDSGSNEIRHINIAKLLYIHMLGHPAHFGQIECLKLVASPKYSDKRLGYLGIMLLLDEAQEVLTLVTNSLKNDMNSSNIYAVGLALCTMGNIASAEMSRDLAPEVERLMTAANSYTKKKATLCAVKIIRKVPDLADQFLPRAKALLADRNHAVILAAVTLLTEICGMDSGALGYVDDIRTTIPQLSRHLKTLISSGSSPEHEVSGINDPFLQVRILRLLRILGRKDKPASEAMNDVLAQVATNIEGSKNVGNSILYETCLAITDIEADAGLRVMAINILGRFLANNDNNIRYVALNTLSATISVDVEAVQRHRSTVLECLQDRDISIRRRALDLCFILINDSNVRMMIRELLIFLEIADPEFQVSMPARICSAADIYAPNKRWHIDTTLRVFKLAGNFVQEEVMSKFIKLVGSVPELHAYTVYKLFYYLKQDLSQEALVVSGVWCIGEYGDILLNSSASSSFQDANPDEAVVPQDMVTNVTESDVIDLMEHILTSPYLTTQITEYVLTALVKLTARVNNVTAVERIKSLIASYSTHVDLEIQQRSVEFSTLLNDSTLNQYRAGVLEHMPVPALVVGEKRSAANASTSPSAAAGDSFMEHLLHIETTSVPKNPNGAASKPNDLLDLAGLSIGGQQPASKPAASSGIDLLADIFGTSPGSTAAAAPGNKARDDIMGLFGTNLPKSSPQLGTLPSGPSGGMQPHMALPLAQGGLNDILGMMDTKHTPSAAASSSTLGHSFIATSISPKSNSSTAHSSVTSPTSAGDFVAYNKNNLTITLRPSCEAGPNPNSRICSIVASFRNAGAEPLNSLSLQIAVTKNFSLQLMPASSATVPPMNSGVVTQTFKVLNAVGGTAEGKNMQVKLRMKLSYNSPNGAVDEIVDFGGFNNFSWV